MGSKSTLWLTGIGAFEMGRSKNKLVGERNLFQVQSQPGESKTCAPQPKAAGQSDKAAAALFVLTSPAAKTSKSILPTWVEVDVDTVHADPQVEFALRESAIKTLFEPSSGILTAAAIRDLALLSPIHIVQRDGHYWCEFGWSLVLEAKRVLESPRNLPVCLHRSVSRKELIRISVLEHVVQPIRYAMSNAQAGRRVSLVLALATKLPEIIRPLTDQEWAHCMRRSLRWFAGKKAKAKNNE